MPKIPLPFATTLFGAGLMCAACAPTLIGANERGGMVSHANGMGAEKAFAVAQEHCKTFDRVARISSRVPGDNGGELIFDCVAP